MDYSTYIRCPYDTNLGEIYFTQWNALFLLLRRRCLSETSPLGKCTVNSHQREQRGITQMWGDVRVRAVRAYRKRDSMVLRALFLLI